MPIYEVIMSLVSRANGMVNKKMVPIEGVDVRFGRSWLSLKVKF